MLFLKMVRIDFFTIYSNENDFSKPSLFLMHKAIVSVIGEPKQYHKAEFGFSSVSSSLSQ